MSSYNLEQSIIRRISRFTLIDLDVYDVSSSEYTSLLKELAGISVFAALDEYLSTYLTRRDLDSVTETLLQSVLAFSEKGFYQFDYNPRQENLQYSKLINAYKYGYDSYDIQYFGNDLISLTFQGIVGPLFPARPVLTLLSKFKINNIASPLLSPQYIKLLELERFVKEGSGRILFIILERAYYGFITRFSWNWDANDAYKINYDMTVNLHPQQFWLWDAFQGDFGSIKTEIAQKVGMIKQKPFIFYSWE